MSHCKSWTCVKPDGDGCDGDHCNEVIEKLRAENLHLRTHHTALHSAATRTVEAWEWWQVDTFDRDQSVPDNAIDALMNVLHSLKPPLSSDSPSPHPAEKGSGT